jgi:hypothetical protein
VRNDPLYRLHLECWRGDETRENEVNERPSSKKTAA